MSNMKNFVLTTFTLVSLLMPARVLAAESSSTVSPIASFQKEQCEKISDSSQRASCLSDINEIAAQRASNEENVATSEKSKEQQKTVITTAAGYAAVKILGSIGLGAIFSGSCYTCPVGTATAVLAFAYMVNINGKYDKKFNSAQKELEQIYSQNKSKNNPNFQYESMVAEVRAIQTIYDAAKEKSKSHGNLQKLFTAVAAAAAIEAAVCSVPYSGCLGNVGPAIGTSILAGISAGMESKAKGETDERVAKAKYALDTTTKLLNKFGKYYTEGDDGEVISESAEAVVAAEISSQSANKQTVTAEESKASESQVNTITSMTSSNSVNTTESMASSDGEDTSGNLCYSSEEKLVTCGELGNNKSYSLATAMKKSFLSSKIDETVPLSGVVDVVDTGLKGDFSKLSNIGQDQKFATIEQVKANVLKDILADKKIPQEVKDQLKEIDGEISDEKLANFYATQGDALTQGAVASMKLFRTGQNDKFDEIMKDLASNGVQDAGGVVTGGEGLDSKLAKVEAPNQKDDLIDMSDLGDEDLDQMNIKIEGQSYQAALNEYMKKSKMKAGDTLNYNEIHNDKDTSLFNIISNRYQSKRVINRLIDKK